MKVNLRTFSKIKLKMKCIFKHNATIKLDCNIVFRFYLRLGLNKKLLIRGIITNSKNVVEIY